MLDSEKTTTRNSVNPGFICATAFNKTNNNLTSRSRHLMAILSPRSSKYGRLEGGMEPGNVGGTKVFAWKKFAVCTAFLVEVTWLWGLGEDMF